MYLDRRRTSTAADICPLFRASFFRSREYWFKMRRKFLSNLSAPTWRLSSAALKTTPSSAFCRRHATNSSAARREKASETTDVLEDATESTPDSTDSASEELSDPISAILWYGSTRCVFMLSFVFQLVPAMTDRCAGVSWAMAAAARSSAGSSLNPSRSIRSCASEGFHVRFGSAEEALASRLSQVDCISGCSNSPWMTLFKSQLLRSWPHFQCSSSICLSCSRRVLKIRMQKPQA